MVKLQLPIFLGQYFFANEPAPSVHNITQFLLDVEGAPDILQSDDGKEFVNSLIKQLSNEFGFHII